MLDYVCGSSANLVFLRVALARAVGSLNLSLHCWDKGLLRHGQRRTLLGFTNILPMQAPR